MKNIKWLAVLLLGLLISGCNYFKNVQLLMTGSLEAEEPVIIPFDYKKDLIIVQANVGGEPGLFLLDTAAFDSKIEQRFAKSIDLSPVTTKQVTTAQGLNGEVSVTQIPEFALGEAKFTKTSAGVLSFGDTSATQCLAPQGLIGANLMGRGYWMIDYQAQTLLISETPLVIPNEAAKIEFERPVLSPVPAIQLKISGHEVSGVLFDTGYNGGLVLPRSLADNFDSESTMHIRDQSTSGIFGANQDNIVVKQLDVKLGSSSTTIPVEFSSLDKALLGNDILEHFDVYLDYQQNSLFLVQRSDIDVDAPRTFIAGLNDNEVDEWVVNRALTSHPVELGDRVLTINGKRPSDMYTDFCDYFLNIERIFSENPIVLETAKRETIEINQ